MSLVSEVPLRSRVLQIGCDTPELSRELVARRGARLTAVDRSPVLVEAARRTTPKLLGIEYAVADLRDLSPEGFDVVVCVDHLDDSSFDDVLAKLATAVDVGGKVVIEDELAARGFCARLRALGRLRKRLRAILPGATIRWHLGGRYTAVWQRP